MLQAVLIIVIIVQDRLTLSEHNYNMQITYISL